MMCFVIVDVIGCCQGQVDNWTTLHMSILRESGKCAGEFRIRTWREPFARGRSTIFALLRVSLPLRWFPSFSRGISCILYTCCFSFPHLSLNVIFFSRNGSPHRERERDGHRAAAAVRSQEGPHRARRREGLYLCVG